MDYTLNTDKLLHIELLEGKARAILIGSTRLCEEARRIHSASRVTTAALGRLLTATAILSSTLKGDTDSLTVMVKGGGPLGTLLCVGKPDCTVKGTVDEPGFELPGENGKLPVGRAVGADGTLTVIKDLGLGEPYVGNVRLVSGEIGEDFAMYFAASEQTPSVISLGVLVGPGEGSDQVLSAGGLLVQMLPGADEAALSSVEGSVGMFANISETLAEYGVDGAVNQLLFHLQPRILESSTPRYLCDCSRRRMERALISLGRAELEEMIAENRDIEMDCHFCNTRRSFTPGELRQLLEKAR